MSALNDSRQIGARVDNRGWRSRGFLDDSGQASFDGGSEVQYETSHPQRSDAYDADGFSVEHQIRTLREIVVRHERQIAALAADKHEHCDHLTTVYEQLEKVLEKLTLPTRTLRDGGAALQASLLASLPDSSLSTGAGGEGVGCRPQLPSTVSKKKAEEKLNELLCQHRDQVYDVLDNFRMQIDKGERETERRLDVVEKSVGYLQSEVRELRQLLHSAEDARQSGENCIRAEVRALIKKSDAEKTALDTTASERAAKVQQCCDELSACLTQLSEDTKAIKKQQQRSEKEWDRQIRSIVATEQRVAEVLEQQSSSIAQLETQDSLEGAFHEVKDWLGDLEKKMVSRGELLKWTESLQQEMSTLRRFGAPAAAVGVGSAGVMSGDAASIADNFSTPRPTVR
ncbi:hypothetical protein N2W54_007527 [Lotmaria passim]